MLRTNLSTRPFYNERAVHAVIGIAAFIVAVLTAITLFQMVKLSRQNTELSSRISRDRGEADRLTREATRIRRGINQDELKVVVAAAREANSLIDQRTFSWTEFFNHIEETLPPDVMLTAVQPAVSDEGMKISMTVVGRRPVDVDEFMEKLEATGAFEKVLNRLEEDTGSGMTRMVVEANYVSLPDEPVQAEPEKKPAAPAAPGRTKGASR
jgi:Tfp pilus assembly protein PilN